MPQKVPYSVKPMRYLPLFILTLFLASGCSPYRFFYYPNKKLYVDPAHLEIDYDMMQYPSLNGKKLFALLFRTEKEPIGTVVHFHGNFGNVSNHFLQSQYLTQYGFDVLVFDYQGYGGSEGKPNPRKTIEDGQATVRYAETCDRSGNGVAILGQSLGGAIGMVTMAKEPLVKGAVIEASFPRYRSMARDVLTRSFILWPLYPFYPWFIAKKYDPERFLDQIPPRPLLFIHGTNDKVIPSKFSKQLFEKAKHPKELWIVEGAAHIGIRSQEKEVYEKRVAKFFEAAFTDSGSK